MGRLVAGAGDYVDNTSSSLNVATSPGTWTFIIWFKIPDNSGGSDFTTFLQERGGDGYLLIGPQLDGGIRVSYRPNGFGESQSIIISTTKGFDDNVWHWAMYVANSASSYELFVDRNSEGTDTTTITATEAAPAGHRVGNAFSMPTNSIVTRHMAFTTNLSISEGASWAYFGRGKNRPNVWWEMGFGSPEPDFSGNGLNGTVQSAMPIGDHAPVAPPFGLDPGYEGIINAAAGFLGHGMLLARDRNRLVI